MKRYDPVAFAQWLGKKADAKCGYLMGAVGQKAATLTEKSWLVRQYADNAAQYAKAKYWLKHAPRVYDCQGLADHYVSKMTGRKVNVYARNNYASWCGVKGAGEIPAEYRVPGAAVFVYSPGAGRITHVGYLERPVKNARPEDDWYVIEARGVMYGVVRTRLSQRTWNRWGLMDRYFDYSDALERYHSKKEYAFGERTLKEGAGGADVAILQQALMLLGYDLGAGGADGVFGAATTRAVNEFKANHDLETDGKAGSKVYRLIAQLLPEGETDEGSAE